MARAEQQAQRIAQRVHHGLGFRGQPAAAAAEGLVANAAFFRLPAAWAWARTTVESSVTQSTSGVCTASNRRFHTPVWAQRWQHLRYVSALPKCAGSVR